MIIIFGLGNPGKEYEKTNHNLGFMAVDKLADFLDIKLTKTGMKSVYGEGRYNDEKVIIVKPQTFMNNSGESVVQFKKKFKDARILVAVDDIDLKKGEVRFRERGSAGTHNGLRSIVSYIGEDFMRVKLGVGKPENDLIDFVLSRADEKLIEEVLPKAVKMICEHI